MAGGVNKVILIGNLGADPEIRYTQAGQAVCEMRLATSEAWKDKQGQKQERVEWHRVIVWGNTAEACAKYLTKGRQVFVDGRIQTRTYDDKQGVKRYVTEIVANDVKFLGGGAKDGTRHEDDGPPAPDTGGGDSWGPGGGGGPSDDLPFAVAGIEHEPSAIAPVLRTF